MAATAIITDSNSGISQKQADELGIHVIPMPFSINEEPFFEDINLSVPEFYERMAQEAEIVTSQPSPESVLKLWKELLKTHDDIVHIPMSSGLSGSCQSAIMLSMDFGGRVQVVNNQRISVTQRNSVLDAIALSKRGKNAAEIKDILEADKYNSSIYIMMGTLHYLKKGGRITPTAAALGTLLRIKPVLQIQGEKLDSFAKARTTNQGKTIMINAIKNDINNRFGGFADGKGVSLQIAHTQNQEAAYVLREELLELFPVDEIYVDQLSLSVACHIGPGSLAIACCKRIEHSML